MNRFDTYGDDVCWQYNTKTHTCMTTQTYLMAELAANETLHEEKQVITLRHLHDDNVYALLWCVALLFGKQQHVICSAVLITRPLQHITA